MPWQNLPLDRNYRLVVRACKITLDHQFGERVANESQTMAKLSQVVHTPLAEEDLRVYRFVAMPKSTYS
jgi:hypothetical protein